MNSFMDFMTSCLSGMMRLCTQKDQSPVKERSVPSCIPAGDNARSEQGLQTASAVLADEGHPQCRNAYPGLQLCHHKAGMYTIRFPGA